MSNDPISREAKLLIQLGEMGNELWKARDRAWKLGRERNYWKRDCLEQCKLLAISADREEKLRTRFRELVQHAKDLDARYERCLKESNARLGDALEYRKERDEARKALQP